MGVGGGPCAEGLWRGTSRGSPRETGAAPGSVALRCAAEVGAEAALHPVQRPVAAIAASRRSHQGNKQERRVKNSVFHGSIVRFIAASRQFWP